jgi:hypothetical protein
MTWDDKLREALDRRVGRVRYFKGWAAKRRGPWKPKGLPVALLVHHTAAAATSSVRPDHPGNQLGANAGVIAYVQNHYDVPAANFTVDRDGTLYVHSAYPVCHAGRGSFRRQPPYQGLQIPDDMGNDYMLGVEVVSKGAAKDFTAAQRETLAQLAWACREAASWPGFRMRLPNHRTWAPTRKVDSRYTTDELRALAESHA